MSDELLEGYRAMASDLDHENEAFEWCEGLIRIWGDEDRPIEETGSCVK